MQKNHNGFISQLKPIHLVLLVAVLLRIPYVFISSYTHDELSALFRLDFNSIGELISKGVITDYHPPLVQIFLYYYTHLFGTAEWVVKLPFALCGIASVWLVYKIGKKYINEQSGLLTAAVLAVTELFVYHSNVARPYAPGLLLVLLFLNYFLKLVVDDDKKIKTKIFYVLFAFLAAATHYFAGLTVGVLGMCGIILLKRQQIISYLVTNAVIVVCFIPLYLIMKTQLSHGGLGGWLGAPEKGYALKFIFYLFHYNWLFLGLFLAALALAFLQLLRKKELTHVSLHIVLGCSFVIIYAIAILYSKYKTPVMQFSILQFGLPFLLLTVFSVFNALPKMAVSFFAVIFMACGAYSLFYTRGYHQMTMDYPYKAFTEFCIKARKYYGYNLYGINSPSKILVITADRPEFIAYYTGPLKLFDVNILFNSRVVSVYNNPNPRDTVWKEIESYNPDMVITGNLDFMTYSMVRTQFPSVEESCKGFLNDFEVCAKQNESGFLETNNSWLQWQDMVIMDSSRQYYNLLDTSVKDLYMERAVQCYFSGSMQSTEKNPLVLVIELYRGNERVLWYGSELYVKPDSAFFRRTFATYNLYDELKKYDRSTLRLKMYLWNAKLAKSKITSMHVQFLQPNYKMYGLTEDFNE